MRQTDVLQSNLPQEVGRLLYRGSNGKYDKREKTENFLGKALVICV